MQKKSGRGPSLGELPKILRFPFNISATAGASDFKFGMRLGKSGRGRGLGELPKILRFPFNISATAGASDFKFGMQFRFSKAHHKITPREKVRVALG